MKICVMTKFKPMGVEEYVDIAKSPKEALSKFRKLFPSMRGKLEDNNLSSDVNNTYLLCVKEVELN